MEKIEIYRTVKSWEEFAQCEDELADPAAEWVFRGESVRREPKTSLQRACEEFDIPRSLIPRFEADLLLQFRRNFPIYAVSPRTANEDDTIGWLSLMRHFGAPSRLLDFTYSFFIAAFFALERPTRSSGDNALSLTFEPAAIWAINKAWLTRLSIATMRQLAEGGTHICEEWGERKASAFSAIFWDPSPPIKTVFPVNPFHFHERLHQQQGLFLCPGDISISFEKNLLALQNYRDNVRLISIDPHCRKDILWKLHRTGLNREMLFPGFEGFATSLCLTGPLVFLRKAEQEQKLGRIPTDDRGRFEWDKY